MKKVADIMTRDVAALSPLDTVQRAAQLMDELNVGVVPVCEEEKLIGVITDRDITVRATAAGWAPAETSVSDAMSANVRSCHADEDIEEVLAQMGDTQIRRVPVVDDDQCVIGIVSLGDLATRAVTETGTTLRRISTPSQPDRPQAY
jgi:CBS domain-containing protein